MSEENVKRGLVSTDEYVVVQKIGGEQSRILRFSSNLKVLIEKLKFDAESAVGQPYGLFEVVGEKCVPMTAVKLKEKNKDQETVFHLSDAGNISKVCEKTDRILVAPSSLKLNPDQKRQKLDQIEVLELKKQGSSSNDLIARLVEGSASFSTRTSFSQSKYIKRKVKKHSDRVLILRPTIRLLTKAYYLKDPERIAMLRIDQLGLILQLAGVHHGKNIIVFEQTLGLISSAVLNRLGGKGACIHIHRGNIAQSIPGVHSMNYDEKTLAAFFPVRAKFLLDEKSRSHKNDVCESNLNNEMEKSQEIKAGEVEDEGKIRRMDRLEKEQKGLEIMKNSAHSLIIATRTVDPTSVLSLVYANLSSSASIVVYSPHLKVLEKAFEWLSNNNSINLSITNQISRKIQILSGRTHPLMSQPVTGGYILSGIKVSPQ